MSSLKRKDAPGGHPPAKSAKQTKEARPAKRDHTKKESKDPKNEGKNSANNPSTSASEAPKSSLITRLKDEEPLFPRGGGSILTPLEQRQIQVEAKADALREDAFDASEKNKQKKVRKRKSAASEAKDLPKKVRDEDAVKIESLNYKRLVKGSLILGQICDISPLEIAVALPNNLVGHVSITAISSIITNKLQHDAEASGSDEEDGSVNEVDLKSLFAIGQYIRASVLSTMEDTTSGKAKRRIELTLDPSETNAGLSANHIVANITIMASIASVQDHGYEMNLGSFDSKLKPFLSRKEIDPGTDEKRLQPGAVFLCLVKSVKGAIVQLSTRLEKIGSVTSIAAATAINSFLPGTAVDVLLTEVTGRGLGGKVLGHLPVTADLVHAGAGPDGVDLESRFKIGERIKARVICNFPVAKEPKLGISLLPHITSLQQKLVGEGDGIGTPLALLPISSIVEKCTVRQVETDIGLFVDIGLLGLTGFVHISRVKDGKVEALYETSGPYKIDSVHRGRVVGYNPVDGMFLMSLEKSVLEQQYLRMEDVPVGEVVTCSIEKIVIGENGVSGLIVKLAEGVTGFVPDQHLADIHLQHPEKKFREGMKVRARVLSADTRRRRLRLTLKKTLVNSEAPAIKTYDEVAVGMQVPGTISKIMPNGAHIKFYGALRGFLPISEMSEAYIKDPNEHFRVGQVVSVHILDVDADVRKLVVSCKDPAAFGLDKQAALKALKIGDMVAGKVTQKSEGEVFIDLVESGLKAILPVGQLTDRSARKSQSALKQINVGQTLSNLMVLDKNERRHTITLTEKPSLVEAGKNGELLTSVDDAKVGNLVSGFVGNITPTAVFIHFGGSLQALMPKSKLPKEVQDDKDFGMYKHQSLSVKIISVNRDQGRFVVVPESNDEPTEEEARTPVTAALNPLDDSIRSADDITFGRVTTARVVNVKETQLNVQLADNIQGRVDVSQIFDTWDEIPDSKEPLLKFREKQIVRVRVMGLHDAKNHRFLPISHRSTHSILELTSKPSDLAAEKLVVLSMDKVQVGSSHIAFVNNIGHNCLWVNLSPTVRGRINAMDASDDLSQVRNLTANFPIGSALRVRVLAVDPDRNRLDLSARSSNSSNDIGWDSIKPNMVVPGRITKVNDRQVMVKLSDSVSGPIHLPDFFDDYDQVNTLKYTKNDVVRVSVVELDKSNKRLRLSTRPSRILSSTSQVIDREITSMSQLSVGDTIRGFVKNVTDKGVFVLLGGQVSALVKIANLSDRYLKEWKDHFQVDQLVNGRVISMDTVLGQVELSLKASVADQHYVQPTTFKDLTAGQIVTGKIRKVEEFGVFIVVDNSANVSGLCHRTEMAEAPVKDAKKLYKEGDVVKAKVLSVDVDKKRINFGLKPSYFDEDTDMDDDENGDAGAALDSDEDEGVDVDMEDGGIAIAITGTDNLDESGDDDAEDDNSDVGTFAQALEPSDGLGTGKYDWTGDAFDESDNASEAGAPASDLPKKLKKQKRSEIQVDRTAELDAHGPQTASDFERLLLGQPDSSNLWIAYMALQMQVSELAKAREIAERAIQSINIREETEKLNVWIAYLNLEVAYGTRTTLEEVFKRACQYNDEQEIHERLTSIYIQSGKQTQADELFQAMLKKFGSKSPNVWTNYAHFLHVTMGSPDRARALLPRATRTLDERHVAPVMAKFGALEFRSPNGDAERGRTTFETLLATWPKKFDLWNQLVDLEVSASDPDPAAVRDVFERGTKVKGLKPRRAMKWFKRWADWEETMETKGRDKVMAKAQDWVTVAKTRKDAEATADDEDGE